MALAPVGTGGGGGGGPAVGTVTLNGSEPAVLVQAGQKGVEGETVYATENIYGIGFQITIPKTQYDGEGPLVTAELYAGYIQEIASQAYTFGISYGQDQDYSGNLVDSLFVTVGDPTGAFLTSVTVALRNANTTATFTALQNAAAAQTALAAAA